MNEPAREPDRSAGPDDALESPLDGVRVVELTNWMAAPGAAAILADMGADVIKVEPLAGDVVRNMMRPPKPQGDRPGVDASFEGDNRGKRSIAVDITTHEGAGVVREIVATSDIFLCNLLPRRQARFGLDPESLLAVRPSLVHATLTGYGLTGPEAERPGFDVTAFFGRGAITDSITEPGAVAPAPRSAQGDHTTSLALVSGILAALRMAERTGKGRVVDVSLLGTATWTMMSDLAAVLVDGRAPTRRDRRHLIAPLANRFRCLDDRWIILNMVEERWWEPFCRTVGLDRLLDDPRFDSIRTRFQNMPELTDTIDATLASKTLAEWGEIFDAAGLIWGPAATMTELAADPQASAAGLFPEIDHPHAGPFRTVAAPMKIAGAHIAPRSAAPEVGEHTNQILASIGFEPERIEGLHQAHVIR
jgi:crotonobetainyl-CoA:carnitine CoA-transferase CaiB-like acyl-CoA transferase